MTTRKLSRAAAPTALLLGALVIGGCLADENDLKATVGLDEDTGGAGGAGGEDVAAPDAAAACEVPTSGLGTATGATFDASIVLKDCDGNAVRLADLMCGKKLTLIDIGAGWCEPCIEEASTLDASVYQPNKDKGLQVISIVFENSQSMPATVAFCKEWRDTYGLKSPVLIDPLFKMEPYFAALSSSTPVNMLVDPSFTIVYKRSGEAPTDLGQTIAAELAK